MAPGWVNLESAANVIPDSAFSEGEPAFKFLNLSKKTRIYGFLGCIIVGFVLSLVGSILLFGGQVVAFAFLFGLGTLVSLLGTGFIIGFFKQLKLMFKPIRVVATLVFLAAIVMVFVGAFVLNSSILCLILVFVQYLAYIWYTLSYIPYARAAVSKAVGLG
ncbi:SFT2-domain-containing protein [Coprinopsis marcescibilis]|uniref:Protein transport protein SFT2 n=1 Tax=Coprinopsis marcescibilis TaxID=230819 RepID=A0A5C3KXS7_COPMA|nr:SFT2-domain-containing protein [Coprinopsis marcescibilis]